MTEFAIGQYGENDWRLVKWDGSTEMEIRKWNHEPGSAERIKAIIDHYDLSSELSKIITDVGTLSDSHVPVTNKGENHTFPWE